jgi:hypothetical protein
VRFRSLTLDELEIEDERSFRHVALYDELKQALRRDGYRFRVPPKGARLSWDRALFLNLTFWDPNEQGDVLVDARLDADVVTHVAWHHLTQKAMAGGAISAGALILGESIASAFDLYLVGRLLGHAPDSRFLETQVPSMAEAAEAAGLSEEAFEALLTDVSAEPERAFEDLRQLLFDATMALIDCAGVTEAAEALSRFEAHRFASLLHHYEISSWILYARAYAPRSAEGDANVIALDEALRGAKPALDWLEQAWLRAPALPASSGSSS